MSQRPTVPMHGVLGTSTPLAGLDAENSSGSRTVAVRSEQDLLSPGGFPAKEP